MATRMMGRTPTPTTAKIAAGNPGGQRIRSDEPKPKIIGSTSPPKDFLHSPLAQKIWRQMADHLRQARMLAETDVLSLAAFCNAASEFFTLDAQVAKLVQAGKWGEMGGGKGRAFSPLVSSRNEASRNFQYWAAQFGMSPAAVSRLIAINVQMDLLEEFLDTDEAALEEQIKADAAKLGMNVVAFEQRKQN